MNELDTSSQVAVIGMAGRFPGAENVRQLWDNLNNGIDSLTTLSRQELLEQGVPAHIVDHENYVSAARVLTDIDLFDYEFFGLSLREAELMDPQIRLLLQCAYHTFEDANILAKLQKQNTGVYVGVGANHYLLENVLSNRALVQSVGAQMIQLVNDRDFAATQIAYRLNLTGPAVSISTACSTSLVAIHNAVQALLSYECDTALAGGASVAPVQRVGYLHQPGGIASVDGRCRPFDSQATGTSHGSGVATVLLKRYDDALADGDKIYAVIRGSAINNDGTDKIGFTAPSINGQQRVVSDAMAVAEVEANDIGYVEAHGTATSLGDPIEFQALVEAFEGAENNTCGLGSLKSNVGHLDSAAGVSGFIKTALSIYHGELPASLHYTSANSQIDIEQSPFYIVNSRQVWKSPRVAGVSSFGMGGTNAHAILAEAEPTPDSIVSEQSVDDWQLLPVTANNSDSLEMLWTGYKQHLNQNSSNLGDIAWSMFTNRPIQEYRSFVVANSVTNASIQFSQKIPPLASRKPCKDIAFMFPGQGSQQACMSAQLYDRFPAYANALEDALSELAEQSLVREFLFQEMDRTDTRIVQPALFCHEYALAQLWTAFDIRAKYLIGHSVGEYVAACLAGVFRLRDAVKIIETRATLMNSMAQGAMIAISTNLEQVHLLLDGDLEVAAINGPSSIVVAGPVNQVDALQQRLNERDIKNQLLKTSHAFHSASAEPILPAFAAALSDIELTAPKIPVISNLTGEWLTAEQATSPQYWCEHLRNSVLFGRGINTIINQGIDCIIEVGSGRALGYFAAAAGAKSAQIIAGVSGRDTALPDFLTSLGNFWKAGGNFELSELFPAPRDTVDLPLYPFKKSKVWLEPIKNPSVRTNEFLPQPEIYAPVWQGVKTPPKRDKNRHQRLIFLADNKGIASTLAKMSGVDSSNISFVPASMFTAQNSGLTNEVMERFWLENIRPLLDGYDACHIVNCWPVDHTEFTTDRALLFDIIGYIGKFLSRTALSTSIEFTTITESALAPNMSGCKNPLQSIAHSLALVMQQEIPTLKTQIIDIDSTQCASLWSGGVVASLFDNSAFSIQAVRDNTSWQSRFVEALFDDKPNASSWVKPFGHYVISGGLGQLGLCLANWLAVQGVKAITLVTRSSFPLAHEWQQLLESSTTPKALKDKLSTLLKLQQQLEELNILSTPWSSVSEINASILAAEQNSGEINGIFHCAAVLDEHTLKPLMQYQAEDAKNQFTAKVDASYALHQATLERNIDFVVLMSSLSSILAGPGHAIYSAANRYLDSLASHAESFSRNNTTQWLSVAWDGWNINGAPKKGMITEVDAPRLFDTLFRDHGYNNLAVSCQELEPRYKKWVRDIRSQPSNLIAAEQKAINTTGSLEQILIQCWQDIIGDFNHHSDANFFALGGDSLAAVRLSSLVQQRLDTFITAAEIFAYSDFSAMLGFLLEKENQMEESILIPLKKGQGEPIILVHPGGGGISVYHKMLERLDAPNPVFGVRAKGLETESTPELFESMSELAEVYVSSICSQIDAPSVTLIGYCFGGLIANELAHVFKRQGVQVSHLFLLDSTHPATREPVENSYAVQLSLIFGDLPEVNPDAMLSMSEAHMLSHVATQAKSSGKFPKDVSDQQIQNYIQLAMNHLVLELNYLPCPFPGLVVLNAIEQEKLSGPLGWKNVEVIDVPGDHKSMMKEPHIDVVTAKITSFFEAK